MDDSTQREDRPYCTLCPARRAKVLKLEQASGFSAGLVETQITGSHPKVADSGGLVISISNELSCEAGPGHYALRTTLLD